jgi:hypothetical protein
MVAEAFCVTEGDTKALLVAAKLLAGTEVATSRIHNNDATIFFIKISFHS